MRSNSRLAVGSPTARVVAIMVATILLAITVAGAGIAGQRLLAAGPIVVAQDGSGTVDTITAAVAMASDGDEILVRPGTYEESVRIDKDITLTGDGPREDVVVVVAEDGPTDATIFSSTPRYAFYLDGTAASVGNLTVAAPVSNVSTFIVVGGSPTIHDVVANIGPGSELSLRGFVFMEAATGVIRNNVTDAFLWVDDGSTPEIVGNETTSAIRTNGSGTDPWIHDNVATGIWAHGGSAPLVEKNVISGSVNPDCGVEAAGPGFQARVRDNQISGNGTGVCLYETGSIAELIGNTIVENGTGLQVDAGSEPPELAGNIICDNDINFIISDGDLPGNEDHCPDGAAS